MPEVRGDKGEVKAIRPASRFRTSQISHGDCVSGKQSKEYKAWSSLRYRCNTKSCSFFHYYGGRGIKVCKRWDKFENFLADMGRAPTESHSIERINNDGNYEPSNCRWATPKEQQNNNRNNRWLTVNGETKTIHSWQKVMNFGRMTILNRIKLGWSIEKAVLTPLMKRK